MPAIQKVKNRSHLRGLIKAEEMINLLQEDILNTDKDHTPMPPQRVNAIRMLLNKVLPDIKAVELTGDAGNPITTNIQVEFVKSETASDSE